MNTSTPVPRISVSRWFRMKSAAALGALLLSFVLIFSFLTPPSSASAFAHVGSQGTVGKVQFSSSLLATGGSITVPGVWVFRNGAVAVGRSQRVWVTAQLQRWNGSSWVSTGSAMTSQPTINVNDGFVQSPTIAVYPTTPGYYAVQLTIAWGYEKTIGTENLVNAKWTMVTSVANDLRCATTRCAQGPGYVQLW